MQVRVVFEVGGLNRLGSLARELGGRRVLLVTDPGLETPTLRCVDLKTGSVRWKKDLMAATITLAADDLLILTERGELIRAAASPDGFNPKA